MSTKNRFRVWFIPRWYPNRNDAMLGLFIRRHAEAVSLFDNVTVLYICPSTKLNKPIDITHHRHGNIQEKIAYYKSSKLLLLGPLVNLLRYLIAAYKLLKQEKNENGLPDLCHVHVLTRTAIPAMWMKLRYHIPYIITEHWSRYQSQNIANGSYKGILRRLFTKYAASQSSHITTVTNDLANAMKQCGLKGKYSVIPNVTDTSLFQPAPGNSNTISNLIHISCFDEPAKNIRGILDAVKILSEKRNDFKLDIIGDGPDKKLVMDHFKKLNIKNGIVEFYGEVSADKIPAHIQNSRALIMFSNYENLPCTIIESMSCGVPVISTDVGGIGEFVTSEMGILIKRGDIHQLVKAIESMLNHSDQFHQGFIRKYAINTFSNEVIGSSFHSLYSQYLLNNRKS